MPITCRADTNTANRECVKLCGAQECDMTKEAATLIHALNSQERLVQFPWHQEGRGFICQDERFGERPDCDFRNAQFKDYVPL